jgi:hypothetical protein
LFRTKSGDLFAVSGIAHLVEKVLAQSRSLNRLQKLLRDDHVGVDVDHGQRCCDGCQGGELLHGAWSLPEIANIGEMTADGCGGGHGG